MKIILKVFNYFLIKYIYICFQFMMIDQEEEDWEEEEEMRRVIEDINLTILPNEKIALVGERFILILGIDQTINHNI